MAVVFEIFWTGTVCAQSTHLLEMAVKRGMGMALSKQFETTSFAVTNPCFLLLSRVESLTERNSLKASVSITEHWLFLFTAPLSHFHTTKKTRIHTRAPPKVSRVLCGDAWRQEAFQQRLPCSIPKHIQIDEAYAGMVAKISEAATPRETFRAPACRPSKWWIGAHAWSALQRQRLSLRKFRSDRKRLPRAAFVTFRSATRRVVDPSNVHEAADSFLCQRVTRWSKVSCVRATRARPWLRWTEKHTSRSLFDQAKAAEYQGNVRVLYKLTREAAGQPRIKPIHSIMMDDHTTMTMGSMQTNERWRQYFAKLLQGHVATLADLRARSNRRLQRAGSCLHDVRFTEQEVRAAIMRKKNGKSRGFDDIHVEILKAGGDTMVLLLCSLFHGIFEQSCIPLWFQGARMCTLWKDKADPRHCSNHRGIQISNVIPSILLEVVKTRAEEKIAKFLSDTQCGRKHGSTTFAMHFARSFMQYEAGGGYNACLLFADLEKACDRVVREMAVGCRCTEADLASQPQCLGLDGDDLQWCLDYLRSDGSVMQESGLDIQLVDIVERIHARSWFCMQESGLPSDQTSVVETQCGGRHSVALSSRSCTQKPHVRLPAVHAVRTCLSLLSCMRKHTGMMKRLADRCLRSHAKASPVASPTCLPTKSFSCGTCGKKFPTLQAASSHGWTVHKRRQIGADYIDDSGRCPVCKRTFHTRLRAIKHVSVATCGEDLATGNYVKIPEAHRKKLDNADRVEARAARKSGISVYRSHGLRAI